MKLIKLFLTLLECISILTQCGDFRIIGPVFTLPDVVDGHYRENIVGVLFQASDGVR